MVLRLLETTGLGVKVQEHVQLEWRRYNGVPVSQASSLQVSLVKNIDLLKEEQSSFLRSTKTLDA